MRRTNGFDALRLVLALGVLAFHSYTLSTGGIAGMAWGAQVAARLILPAFFALSGYLISGSLARVGAPGPFLALRLLRLMPALLVVTLASVFLLGPALGRQPLAEYFSQHQTWAYFGNLWGQAQFSLPGIFEQNPRSGVVNGALWTIPLEMACYLALALTSALRDRARLAMLLACTCVLLLPFVAAHIPAPDLLLAFVCGALLHQAQITVAPRLGGAAIVLAFMSSWVGWQMLTPVPLACAVVALARLRVPQGLTRADYSFGVYLVGYPVQQGLLQASPHLAWWMLLLVALPVSLLLAAGLWHGVESPILRRKHQLLALTRWRPRAQSQPLPEPI